MATATIDIGELLESREGVWSGRPCIKGTRTTVHLVAAHHLQGMTVEEILDGFPRASLAGIHAALAYYHAHKAEIDADLDEDAAFAEEAARQLGAELI
jgi:uncharacterized protein (DUF433 family)